MVSLQSGSVVLAAVLVISGSAGLAVVVGAGALSPGVDGSEGGLLAAISSVPRCAPALTNGSSVGGCLFPSETETTGPTLAFIEPTDPPHDGTIRYPIRGILRDVPIRSVWNVTVTVDGISIPQRVIAYPTSENESRFGVPVEISADVNRIVVTATLDRTMTEAAATGSSSEQIAAHAGLTVTATLKLDGDGLPGRYEVSATGTDPLDPDSDATGTATDESTNGVLDGREDFDADQLPTYVEREVGSDPLLADSDADGLPDAVEISLTDVDPLVVDSDGDGISDADEDADGDGLSNREEADAGTSSFTADSDADNLSDPEELALGTDPTQHDTDGDGLDDGVEPYSPYNTDPLDPDTNGDGTLDGAESVSGAVHNTELGVTVVVHGTGSTDRTVRISSGASSIWVSDSVLDSSVSPVVELEGEGVANATLTLAVELEGTGPFKIYRYNRTYQTYVGRPSTIGPDGETISANISEPGLYVAMNETSWDANFEGPPTG